MILGPLNARLEHLGFILFDQGKDMHEYVF